MTVVLWHIEISHYNEKARWALDYKGIPHERRVPMPGLHGVRAGVLTRGRHRRLPILDLDGRRVADSTAIVAALEQYRPDPPLYPDDPAERAEALALEDEFDERLAPPLRLLTWFHTLPDTDATIATLFTSPSPGRERLLRLSAPVARRMVSLDYGVNEANATQAEATLRETMDLIESRIGPSGYLVGDRFSVADLTGAALFTPLIAPPQRQYAPPSIAPGLASLREELTARPGGEWVHEMYARHRGTWARPGAADPA